MTAFEPSTTVNSILQALSGNRWPVEQAEEHVRSVPGLYAIYGDIQAWMDLGFDPRPNDPLYVGRSESSLVDRELKTHFAAISTAKAQTGSSTARRSFSALLREILDLNAVPRNINNPGHFTNYGLTSEGDARLTTWMYQRLTLTLWEQEEHRKRSLEKLETIVIRHWMPPTNIAKNPRPLERLRIARQEMALEAASSHCPDTTSLMDSDDVHSARNTVSTRPQASRSFGRTPVELARELGKNPKTVRQVLRDKYGALPCQGDRWGVLTLEQETYVRHRIG